MKVDTLQLHHTGLGVQVFRKAGHNWLETIETDSLTLEEQNLLGLEYKI